ncbi:hypothetical protein, partial [Salmonella enterica]|uniref:hypothetical protein n=1 Tax=Salmonella enterica TaxID=28901 RepID=UPI001ADB31D9
MTKNEAFNPNDSAPHPCKRSLHAINLQRNLTARPASDKLWASHTTYVTDGILSLMAAKINDSNTIAQQVRYG